MYLTLTKFDTHNDKKNDLTKTRKDFYQLDKRHLWEIYS